MPRTLPYRSALLALTLCLIGCGDDGHDDGGHDTDGTGSPDHVGSVCVSPSDCYPDVDPNDLAGDPLCLDRVRAGYCTHECSADADCCAAEGECQTDLPQVCSPFESTNTMMCFLSCERENVDAAGAEDEQAFCQHEVSPDFICRSSGGSSDNRKVCVPGDCGVGATCGEDADCASNLECVHDYDGGYCSVPGCQADADCPGDARCVQDGDVTYCARSCAGAPDCSFCRGSDVAGHCTDEVEFVDAESSTPVCVVDHA